MKKILSLVSVLFVLACGRENNILKMGKYCYPLFMEKRGRPLNNGTGFFIRRNGQLYLITCYHVVAPVNTMLKTINPIRFDSIETVLDSGNQRVKRRFDISKIGDTSKAFYFFEKPDVFAYPIDSKLLNNATVNLINPYITTDSKMFDDPDSVYATGYPTKELIKYLSTSTLPLRIASGVNDSIAIATSFYKAMLTNSYLLTPATSSGFSGSPVFFLVNEKMYFAGMILGHYDESAGIPNPTSIAVKPGEILKLIDEQSADK